MLRFKPLHKHFIAAVSSTHNKNPENPEIVYAAGPCKSTSRGVLHDYRISRIHKKGIKNIASLLASTSIKTKAG
jgi:hypothetical protein